MLAAPQIVAGEGAQQAALIVMGCGAALLTIWSAVDGLRRQTFIPLLALLGGVIALPSEPFWDVNVQFVFAADSDPTAFTAFGRPIPLYLAFIYPAFIGWGSYLGYRLIRSGAPRNKLLMLPLAFFVADAVIEIIGIKASLWSYYGDHSWNPLAWPIYFGMLNATIPLLGGWLLVGIENRTRGLARAFTALAVPTAYAGIYAAAGWPTWAALNASVPDAVVWVAGAATILIAASCCWLVAESSDS